MPSASDGASRTARIAASNLHVDHATAGLLKALDAATVPSLLLKGPGVSRWLYEKGSRLYFDTDLLVDPRRAAAAADVLTGMGYEPEHHDQQMPDWWRDHAVTWSNPEHDFVDLHHTLPGVGVTDQRLWELMTADAALLEVGGHPARVPSIAARTLHVALHAAQQGGAGGPAQRDLERALERVDIQLWETARALAIQLQADQAFAAGLRTVPAGRALADQLSLDPTREFDVAVRAAGVPREALTVELLARAPSARARLRIISSKCFPPPTYMRVWSQLARRGRVGLAASYLQRTVWLAAHLPAAIRIWMRVRKELAAVGRGRERR